jgi:SecD/SecF fusion protein
MKNRTGIRLLLCLMVFGIVIYNLYPVKDIPFETYLRQKADTDKAIFVSLLEAAREKVSIGESPSLFVALKTLGESQFIDYSQFFKGIRLIDIKDVQQKNSILLNHLLQASHARLKQGLDLKGGIAFTLEAVGEPSEAKTVRITEQNMQKAVEILRKRIDSLGVAEPMIRVRGDNQIEIQLPGVSTKENPEVINLVKKPAKLEFRLAHPDRRLIPDHITEHEYPTGYEVLSMDYSDAKTEASKTISLFIKKEPEMTGKSVKEAHVVMNSYGAYEVVLHLTPEGTERFAKITRTHIGESLGIILDNKLYCAPSIRNEIADGNASISGSFTQREAFELASVLNNPLEFELKLTEVYEVGPSLAEDARSSSINAAFLGALFVIVFMLGYYFILGGVAVISVIFNVLIVLGMMAAIGATLTLPAIAGLALTVGMSVDANILIFERMREELQHTRSFHTVLEAAHKRAFAAIIDANLTTLLTAAILIWLGTGPIKGFGVTLAIGILASLFCVLVFSKVCLEYLVRFKLPTKWLLPINLFRNTNFDFVKHAKLTFIISWLIVLIGTVSLFMRRDNLYALDFSGGDEITIQSNQKLSTATIQSIAKEADLGSVIPIYKETKSDVLQSESGPVFLKIQTESGKSRSLFNALQKTYQEAELEVVGETHIGASVSHSIKKNAFISVAMALFGLLIYVAFRFELGYGIGAFVSTIHDIFLTLSIYVLLGGKFSGSMIAALLMVIGYSINDTIVVFDRIREELTLNPHMSLKRLVNFAINRTLSRTLLTSLTTFLAAFALYAFGCGEIAEFALVFIIGIVVGTFSSIFIASPVFLWFRKVDAKKTKAIT